MAYFITSGRKGYDLELQIVVHSAAAAQKEIKDLRKLGCENVKAKEFAEERNGWLWLDAQLG